MGGYKTYLVAAAIAVTAALHYLGFINDTLFQAINGVLLGGGLAALRAGVAKGSEV